MLGKINEIDVSVADTGTAKHVFLKLKSTGWKFLLKCSFYRAWTGLDMSDRTPAISVGHTRCIIHAITVTSLSHHRQIVTSGCPGSSQRHRQSSEFGVGDGFADVGAKEFRRAEGGEALDPVQPPEVFEFQGEDV